MLRVSSAKIKIVVPLLITR